MTLPELRYLAATLAVGMATTFLAARLLWPDTWGVGLAGFGIGLAWAWGRRA